ncbi:hypothetical protein [Pseudonocardia sp. KRD291]|uniref:hypothetical protein n=1 Tax=Pseudonocardia sp. KRD291 TaxID=2792007 RepID=UPI001C49F154|nr:hypothetical protein [Pseudonocardia sp. KRD291]MBW0103251.1 hypothetical protein [Pseudonocardia sp. KRD291]
MSLGLWIVLGIAVWLVLGVAVALLVGRIARHRDRQVPDDAPGTPEPGPAEQPSPSGRGAPGPGGQPDGRT